MLELDDDESKEILWALLHWAGSCPEKNRMSDGRLDELIEKVRAVVHHRAPEPRELKK